MKSKSNAEKFLKAVAIVIDLVLFGLIILQIFHPLFDFGSFGVFSPAGTIANQQKQLMLEALGIMLVIILPVVGTGFFIAFKYRADKNEDYDPAWGDKHSKRQFLWWSLPGLIILLLSIINFHSAHKLDPSKAIASKVSPVTIQVVALPWKWLFIYPEQNIATVNFVEFPQNTPVRFELTADAPMSLFWIPQLGGQMAAMTGMVNELNLEANNTGQFTGQNSEINGQGYAGMKFIAQSAPQSDFDAWVTSVKNSAAPLGQSEYNKLAAPSENNPPQYFSSVDRHLYSSIIQKYMSPPKIEMDE